MPAQPARSSSAKPLLIVAGALGLLSLPIVMFWPPGPAAVCGHTIELVRADAAGRDALGSAVEELRQRCVSSVAQKRETLGFVAYSALSRCLTDADVAGELAACDDED